MERHTTYGEGLSVTGGYKQISWAAVFAGALIAVGIQLLLSLLGLGIGASSIDPQTEDRPFAGIGTGALIWWIVSFILSLFAGGWIAGRLTGSRNKFNDAVHGLLTWVLFVFINLWLLSSAAGGLIRTASGLLGSTVSMISQGAVMNAPELEERLESEANRRGIDRSDVEQKVDSLKAKLPEYKEKAKQVGDDVARGVSKSGIYGFFGLLLGAAIASFGAVIGRRSYTADQAIIGRNINP